MASELASELLHEVTNKFNKGYKASDLSKILESLGESTSYADASKYAANVGNVMAKALRDTLVPEALPDGKLYYNIANDVVIPALRKATEYAHSGSAAVQRNINEAAGIPFKPVKPSFNIDRAKNLIDRLTEFVTEDEEENEWLLGDDVIGNFCRSAVNDDIEANAEFDDEAGFTAYVTRSTSGGCCAWCEDMAGTYELGKQPDDFWRMHKDCSCTIDYVPSRTKWSRISYIMSSGKMGKRTEDL